jgi:hypothetical protein
MSPPHPHYKGSDNEFLLVFRNEPVVAHSDASGKEDFPFAYFFILFLPFELYKAGKRKQKESDFFLFPPFGKRCIRRQCQLNPPFSKLAMLWILVQSFPPLRALFH